MKNTDSDLHSAQYRVTPVDESGARLLRRYLERRRGELIELRRAVECGDFQLIGRIGHNLRGSGAAYELVRISALGERLEEAAARASAPALTRVIADLEQFVASITVGDPEAS